MEHRKKKILMVDDDEEICQEMSQILSDEGHQVSTVCDGLKARELIGRNRFDLILLDLKIPRLSGFELLKLIKQRDQGPKVIVVSARPMKKLSRDKSFIGESGSSDEEEEKILDLADEFVNKPFDVATVLQKIEQL